MSTRMERKKKKMATRTMKMAALFAAKMRMMWTQRMATMMEDEMGSSMSGHWMHSSSLIEMQYWSLLNGMTAMKGEVGVDWRT